MLAGSERRSALDLSRMDIDHNKSKKLYSYNRLTTLRPRSVIKKNL